MNTVSNSGKDAKILLIFILVISFAISIYLGSSQSQQSLSKAKPMLQTGDAVEGEFKVEENGIAWPGTLRITNLDNSGMLLGEVTLVFARE